VRLDRAVVLEEFFAYFESLIVEPPGLEKVFRLAVARTELAILGAGHVVDHDERDYAFVDGVDGHVHARVVSQDKLVRLYRVHLEHVFNLQFAQPRSAQGHPQRTAQHILVSIDLRRICAGPGVERTFGGIHFVYELVRQVLQSGHYLFVDFIFAFIVGLNYLLVCLLVRKETQIFFELIIYRWNWLRHFNEFIDILLNVVHSLFGYV